MGVLKTLTDEYFGKKLRTEDKVISTLIKKCIEDNKRDSFIKLNEGWGEDGKVIMLYEEGETIIGEAKFMTIDEAVDFFERGFVDDWRCLHIENFKATPDTYKSMTAYNALPENIQEAMDKMFELYCEYPSTISYFTHILYNLEDGLDDNIFPGDLCVYAGGDEYFTSYYEYEEGDDVVEFITTDGCFFTPYNDNEYSAKWEKILEELRDAFRKEKFKECSDNMGAMESSDKRYFFGKIK